MNVPHEMGLPIIALHFNPPVVEIPFSFLPHILQKHNDIIYLDYIDDCSICRENKCNVQTSCNHTFCESCIKIWLKTNNTCPCCRHFIANTLFQPIQLKAIKWL